ncbi:2-hydroxyacid dehydrogenase [Maritimibacter dapengensis]|uniref:D-glycerate dehydrogenase n=1 Tax=Maritimibacter dapengensis TaxID=2836868 RepID=A0ABS6T5V6_9RHOB|nr:D-glycerate dehydrogenase [Maritimibacter dapengensis]MBV7380646.1 D-glycerate dehydrogenase [Maritimibacter dapengensis]
MGKVLVTRPMPDIVIERLTHAHDVSVRKHVAPMSSSEMIASLRDFDVVMPTLGDAYCADIFDAVGTPRCQLLANFGVGFNHIDVAAAHGLGIQVTNTPGAVTDATADIALTLILMTARRAGEGERLVRRNGWDGWNPMQLLGQHVTGKTLGVVGMGRIGEAIARRCHFGFEMNVVFHNRSSKEPGFPARQLETIEAVASQADFLVVAVPGGSDTRHLIDKQVFGATKPNAIFVNISRGEVVKEADLVEALTKGEIAGAGLDVYEFEPEVPDALKSMEQVTLLPHLGTATLEVRTQMGLMAAKNILTFLAEGTLLNPV